MHRLLETITLCQMLQPAVLSPAVQCQYALLNVKTKGAEKKRLKLRTYTETSVIKPAPYFFHNALKTQLKEKR